MNLCKERRDDAEALPATFLGSTRHWTILGQWTYFPGPALDENYQLWFKLKYRLDSSGAEWVFDVYKLSSAFAFCISTEFRISALEISAQKKSAVVNNELEISELEKGR